MNLPDTVEIIEVGPRDGLQNEKNFIPTHKKIELINLLNQTGIKRMEATSFVHPVYVPQMKDAKEVLEGIEKKQGIQYMALVPNEKGYLLALENDVKDLSFVVGASDDFNMKNVGMSSLESMKRFEKVIGQAKDKDILIRFNIATSFWCPYKGKLDEKIVIEMAKQIDTLGVDEIVICDTLGRANPKQVFSLLQKVLEFQPKAMITAHFHDTYGFAQANIVAALQAGVRRFDTSIGGLGGCPFAPGAAGNVATEDVAFMMQEMGIETGLDLSVLKDCVEFVRTFTERDLTGHYHKLCTVPV